MPTKQSFRGRAAFGSMAQLYKTDHGKQTLVQYDDSEAPLDFEGFLSYERLERLDQEARMDLDAELMNEQDDLRDAMDLPQAGFR